MVLPVAEEAIWFAYPPPAVFWWLLGLVLNGGRPWAGAAPMPIPRAASAPAPYLDMVEVSWARDGGEKPCGCCDLDGRVCRAPEGWRGDRSVGRKGCSRRRDRQPEGIQALLAVSGTLDGREGVCERLWRGRRRRLLC